MVPPVFAGLTSEDVAIATPVTTFVAVFAFLCIPVVVVAVIVAAACFSMAMDVGVWAVHVVAVACSRRKSV